MATPIPAYSSMETSLPPSPKAIVSSFLIPRYLTASSRPTALELPSGTISRKAGCQRVATYFFIYGARILWKSSSVMTGVYW